MKKNTTIIRFLSVVVLTVVSALLMASLAMAATPVVLKVGASVTPHADILNFIKPTLAKQGIDLRVIVLDSDAQLNPALQEKQIDANYFQHVPYLDSVK